jgi:hypothetical protein
MQQPQDLDLGVGTDGNLFGSNQIVLSENSCERRRRQNPSVACVSNRNRDYLVKACMLHKSVASKTVAVAPDLVMRPARALSLGCPNRQARGCEDAK